jgi:hypothetical protein
MRDSNLFNLLKLQMAFQYTSLNLEYLQASKRQASTKN